jgi:hypothetical protein
MFIVKQMLAQFVKPISRFRSEICLKVFAQEEEKLQLNSTALAE